MGNVCFGGGRAATYTRTDSTPSGPSREGRAQAAAQSAAGTSGTFEGLPRRQALPSSTQQARVAIGAALKRPNRTVCVDVQVPRPRDAGTPEQRSTMDGRITLKRSNDRGRTSIEIGSSLYHMPPLQIVEGDEATSPRSTAVGILSSQLSEMAIGKPRAPSGRFNPELPGLPESSRLSDRQIELIGVARWPAAEHNLEDDPSNRQYGHRFHATARDAADRIANGQITSWRQLWHFASAARHSWALQGGNQGEALNARRFAGGYPRDEPEYGTRMTGKYEYVAQQVWRMRRELPVQTNGLIHLIRQNHDVPDDFMSHRVLEANDKINDTPIKLTKLLVPNGDGSDFMTPIAGEFQEQHFLPAYPCVIEHTDPELVQPITNHVEHLFEELMGSLPAEDQAIRQLGGIHWWMAHAMPDARGSAAKTELCIRAMAGAMGMELPPFEHGVIPDLEAFMTDRETYADNYVNLFEHTRQSF